jgi:hypothetical protein
VAAATFTGGVGLRPPADGSQATDTAIYPRTALCGLWPRVIVVLRKLARPAGGELGDLLLHPPPASISSYGVASHGDRRRDALQGQVSGRSYCGRRRG